MLGSLAQANGLLKVEPHAVLKKGQAVTVKLL
jgi:molybdopterin biosynthesis enzyme